MSDGGRMVLQVQDLRCAYLEGRTVLSVPELSVYRGEVLFILGRSGVGKSTLLELIALMNKPAAFLEGEVRFFGQDDRQEEVLGLWNTSLARLSGFRRHHYSFIFQEPNFLDHYTARENMLLPALAQGNAMADTEREVIRLMGELDLDPSLLEQPPSRLSGGQRQRMAFIRALVPGFDVLFGDEPTGNLDPVSASRLMRLLRDRISDSHHAAVVVSHDLGLARSFADRIAVITRGGHADPGGHLLRGNILVRQNGAWIAGDRSWSEEALPAYLHHCLENEEISDVRSA